MINEKCENCNKLIAEVRIRKNSIDVDTYGDCWAQYTKIKNNKLHLNLEITCDCSKNSQLSYSTEINNKKTLEKLKEEKMCPSELGLKDVLMPECEYKVDTNCDSCREKAINL